jgi:hypothetical protein
MENLNELFNLSAEDLIQKSESKSTDRWNPTADKGKEGVYSAVVRFIAWHENPKKSIMKKWTCWLVDPLTDKGRYVDCPSSLGQKSPLQDIYWKLKKSESVAEQKLAEKFSRRQSFAALVQIIKDDNAPETVGKVFVWNFGVKIYNKIQEQMQPEFGTPHIPFDLFDGKPFHVKITKVAGYNNYDNSRFLDNSHPIMIDNVKMSKTPEDMQKIIEFLKSNSPDLSKYDFQDWDDDTIAYVNDVIQNTVPGGRIVENVRKSNAAQGSSQKATVVEDPLAELSQKSSKESLPKSSLKSESLPTINNELDDLDSLDDTNFDDDLYNDL